MKDFFWQWCCNPTPEAGGCEVQITSIQRPVLTASQLEQFRKARSLLRNPFAPARVIKSTLYSA